MNEVAEPRTALRYRTRQVGAFSVVLTICLATVAVTGVLILRTPGDAPKLAIAVMLTGASLVLAVGLSDLARGRNAPYARLLIGAGLLWSMSALSASRAPVLYSLGRVGQWLTVLAIVYLLLLYPSGRLTGTAARRLAWAAALIVGLMYLPTALIVKHFPTPAAWSTCHSSCPANAFGVTSSTPGFMQALAPARETLSVLVLAAVFVVVRNRRRNGGPLLSRVYAPIVFAAVLLALALMVQFFARRVDPNSWSLSVSGWSYVLLLPVVALACIAGRLYPRLFAARALERLALSLGSSATAAHVSQVMAITFEDASLRILHSFPADPAWVDESGRPVAVPSAGVGQHITEVSTGDWRIAVIHSEDLDQEPTLVRSAGSYALAAIENRCLNDELRSSLRDLAESRALRLTAERHERQKIERDLHDGAQQRLVALRLKLGLAADRLADHDPAAATVIRGLGNDVDATIDSVRSLARGIYPALLTQTGLLAALRSTARAAALPTVVHGEGLRRYPTEIEAAVYFSCSEALQNAAKHGHGANGVTISVWQDEELHFEVHDDGTGFDLPSTPLGAGLTNLTDRLAAVGGSVRVQSAPGQGTLVGGSIPLPGR